MQTCMYFILFLLGIQANRYITSFVDRDMFMRYRGGGVGHKYMRTIEQWLWTTGWGNDIPEVDEPEPAAEEEVVLTEEGSDSGTESGSDGSEVDEEGSGEDEIIEDEETLEGEYGYSIF